MKSSSERSFLQTHPILSLILSASRLIAVPFALVACAVVRGGKDQLEVDSTKEPVFHIEDGTIRTQAVIVNPTSHAIEIDRVELTATDSLGTFTLRSETQPATVPAGYSLIIDLVATNFRPLRMSRRCVFRARFFSKTGCLCTFAHPFTNLWPAQYFEDNSRPIAHDFIPFAAQQAIARANIDRRHEAGSALN